MSEITETTNNLARLVNNEGDRRRFLQHLGVAGLGAAALGIMGSSQPAAAQAAITDLDVFNFALNLEYLEAEFYVRAAFGRGLSDADTGGVGTRGAVTGGRQVTFASDAIRQYAEEIAGDEEAHVKFFRSALGSAAIARPVINLQESFTMAARAAGVINSSQTFDPYADENSFLIGAFIFEDVGVTAFRGAAPLLTNKDNLSAAAGVLAVEAYHAGNIRVNMFARGLASPAQKISDLRGALGGGKDQGIIGGNGQANIVPTDANGLAFARTTREVLNIVYGAVNASSGLFFPQGVNGNIKS
ncbi:MAG: ferritin-like domain-containing protein [Pyrinomonadaceae bacterium]